MNDNIIKILIQAKDEASGVLSSVKKHAAETAQESQRFATGLAAAAAAAGAFVGYGAKVAGDLEASRAGFITLLGSATEADKILAQIKKDAASTPFELPGLIQANQLLTSVTKDGMRSEAMLMNVGKALAAMGKGQPELDRIIVNLQQIGAVGKASLMDVRQFAFAGIPIFEMLSKATGKTGEDLETFISEGNVTFGLLEQMFAQAGGAGGQFEKAFANQAGGFNQTLANLKDNITVSMADIVQSSGAFDMIKNAMKGVSDWISANSANIASGIKDAFVWVQNNGPLVAGILTGMLAPAFGALALSIGRMVMALGPFALIGGGIALLLQNYIEKAGGVSQAIEKAKNTFNAWKPVLAAIAGGLAAVGLVIASVVLPPIFAAIAANIALAASWVIAFAPIFLIGAAVALIIYGIIKYWDEIKKAAISAWQAIYNFVAPIIQGIGSVVSAVFNAIVGVVMFVVNLIIGYFRIWLAVYMYIFAVIRGVALAVWWFIYNGAVKPVLDAIAAAMNWLSGVITGIFNGIRNFVVGVWQGIYNFAAPIINRIASTVGSAVNTMVGFFGSIWGRISGAIGQVASGISGGIRGAFDGAKQGVVSAINWIIDKVNGVINSVNNTAGKLPGVPKLGHIPRLYTGGQITQGGIAIVGESGPEAVMLPQGAQVVSNRATQAAFANGGVGGGGNNVTIKVEYNGRGQFSQEDAVSMAKQIRDALRAQGLDMNQLGALRG